MHIFCFISLHFLPYLPVSLQRQHIPVHRILCKGLWEKRWATAGLFTLLRHCYCLHSHWWVWSRTWTIDSNIRVERLISSQKFFFSCSNDLIFMWIQTCTSSFHFSFIQFVGSGFVICVFDFSLLCCYSWAEHHCGLDLQLLPVFLQPHQLQLLSCFNYQLPWWVARLHTLHHRQS